MYTYYSRLNKEGGKSKMAGIYTVIAKITPELQIKIVFASQKVAKDVRDQLKKDGYTTTAQLIKELD